MSTTVNPDKLNAFMGKAVGDIGAAISAALVLIGDSLGLYKALARSGPATAGQLAKAESTSKRPELFINGTLPGSDNVDAGDEMAQEPAEADGEENGPRQIEPANLPESPPPEPPKPRPTPKSRDVYDGDSSNKLQGRSLWTLIRPRA